LLSEVFRHLGVQHGNRCRCLKAIAVPLWNLRLLASHIIVLVVIWREGDAGIMHFAGKKRGVVVHNARKTFGVGFRDGLRESKVEGGTAGHGNGIFLQCPAL
jgi:hypothetical protein